MTACPAAPFTHALFETDPYRRAVSARIVAVAEGAVALDRTCFFPRDSGQPGDTGTMACGATLLRVADTFRDPAEPNCIWHACPGNLSMLYPGMVVQAQIDWRRRHAHMRLHSALYLLCALIGAPVTGCAIAETRARIDVAQSAQPPEKTQLSQALARLVREDHPVRCFTVAPPSGAVPLRGPGFGVRPRLVQVGALAPQPCGGPHVASTAEIGAVLCQRIDDLGRDEIRRFTIALADRLDPRPLRSAI